MTQSSRRSSGRPVRHSRNPVVPEPSTTVRGMSPVKVRLSGDDAAVRQLVDALQQSTACGPADYKPSRYGAGVLAYFDIVVPVSSEGTK
ncbi:MAG TPA: hypothetical protein VIU15_38365 [Streptomyces sp.]